MYVYTNWRENTVHSKETTYKKSVVKKEWSTTSSGMDVMSPTKSLFGVWPFGVEIDDTCTSPEDAKSSISGSISTSKSNLDQSTDLIHARRGCTLVRAIRFPESFSL